MSRRTTRRRSSAVVLTCAGLALGATTLGAAAATGATANGAPLDPVSDCAVPFPVSELATGDPVDGLTVTSGTTPTGFTGTVLGVLQDGIAPDIDMIMVDLDMPEFARTGGVWQGMSGSPVYAQDGRLIGAVAYGLSWGPSPIAGITPYEAMDDYLTPSTTLRGSVRLGKADARLVADRAGVTREQAARGFQELPMPLGVAGVSARRLAQAEKSGPKFLQKDTYLLGRAGVDAAGPETIVAGGNLAASASYGDITYAGVGTATSVCNGEVVGFGHPLFGLGDTTLGLHPADAIYIQPDSLGSPFKVANIGPVAGTITDDRSTGITGAFGAAPDATTVSSDVVYGARSRLGTTDVTVADALPDVTFYELLANQDRVLDGNHKGTSVQGWTVRGSDDGSPFRLRFEDRFTSSDLSFETSCGPGRPGLEPDHHRRGHGGLDRGHLPGQRQPQALHHHQGPAARRVDVDHRDRSQAGAHPPRRRRAPAPAARRQRRREEGPPEADHHPEACLRAGRAGGAGWRLRLLQHLR